MSSPPASDTLPITWPRLVKSSAPLPDPPITVPGAWMMPVSVLMTVLRPLVFCDQMATELLARIVPLLVTTLPAPWKLIASALPCVPCARICPPAATLMMPLLRTSTVLPPVLNNPATLVAVALTVLPAPIETVALSRSEIALALPTATVAPGCSCTERLSSAALLPVPSVLVHGVGGVASQTVLVPVVMQSALTFRVASSSAVPAMVREWRSVEMLNASREGTGRCMGRSPTW